MCRCHMKQKRSSCLYKYNKCGSNKQLRKNISSIQIDYINTDAKIGRTTIMVTPKLPAMRMCNRILVIHGGAVSDLAVLITE